MQEPHHPAKVLPEPERSAVVASSERHPRKREACSDKCRAALSRQRGETALRARDVRLRELLEAAVRLLEEGLK